MGSDGPTKMMSRPLPPIIVLFIAFSSSTTLSSLLGWDLGTSGGTNGSVVASAFAVPPPPYSSSSHVSFLLPQKTMTTTTTGTDAVATRGLTTPRWRHSPATIVVRPPRRASSSLLSHNDDDDDDDVGGGGLSGGGDLDDLFGSGNSNDEGDDEEEMVDSSWGEEGLSALSGKKLGIDVQLSFSQDAIEDIKDEARSKVVNAYDSRLADISDLKAELEMDAKDSIKRREDASSLSKTYEMQNLMDKIDAMTGDFLDSNRNSRDGLERATNADSATGRDGRGVVWGSWGDVGYGDVVIDATSGGGGTRGRSWGEVTDGDGGGGGGLLGGVEAARRTRVNTVDDDDGYDVGMVGMENRVLIVADEKKDKSSKLVIDELSRLLVESFAPDDVTVDVHPPLSVPMGGDGASTVIIFASSLDTPSHSSLESVLSRVLRRTAPVAGRPPMSPPSHALLVSVHGTERTGKMPYSMKNLLGGGKLDGIREMETGLVLSSRGAVMGGRRVPLDYTIVKFGDVEAKYDGAVRNENASRDGMGVSIRPGDALDGGIGPIAAANVLLQAVAFQPYARNVTLCAEGGMITGSSTSSSWNDEFLRLSGPELLRVDMGSDRTDDDLEELKRYVELWSESYDGGGTAIPKGSGLTTPAIVMPSRRPPSSFDGVVYRTGVRILFRTTNTGDRYKSSTEERMDERARSGGGTKTSSSSSASARPTTSMAKERKEGGVEVLIERAVSGNVRVRARRCNIDDKTVVKEMSEGVIVGSLRKALGIWIDTRSVRG